LLRYANLSQRQVSHFDVAKLKRDAEELEAEMGAPGFWDDLEHANSISKHMKNVQGKLDRYNHLCSSADEVETMIELGDMEDDADLEHECAEEIKRIYAELEEIRLTTLLSDEYDTNDALLSLHAGAGGTEAQDWVQMLYRMYTYYCQKHGFELKELDMLDGDEAGIKSVEFQVSGEYAYGFLKCERGVHRLVRISPFDANARRQTSFASLDVAPIIEEDTSSLFSMEDVRVDTYRASGKGGQHVNRTDSAVRMTHLPTGIVVQCQSERSQIQNRETCIRMLTAKLAERREEERQQLMSGVKGELKKIEWGSQIRSYVFQPYTMVKDHRTDYEVGNIQSVMDGELDGFITAYLQKSAAKPAE
jgi:peptide chain release factor 2